MSREDFLAERRIAVLSTEDPDGLPYLTAICFAYEGGAFPDAPGFRLSWGDRG